MNRTASARYELSLSFACVSAPRVLAQTISHPQQCWIHSHDFIPQSLVTDALKRLLTSGRCARFPTPLLRDDEDISSNFPPSESSLKLCPSERQAGRAIPISSKQMARLHGERLQTRKTKKRRSVVGDMPTSICHHVHVLR